MRLAMRAVVLVGVLACMPRTATAQVEVGAEFDRDRVTYHFDTPSTITTPELVPHFFEQHYVLDNVWLTGLVALSRRPRLGHERRRHSRAHI
jgi:hypothetical protein